ncbi:MAG: hypothetical protein IH932_03295 [Thaumarchaeota archaeon]|nr:hypothetical protein [Nitrososphaerota archaeon]
MHTTISIIALLISLYSFGLGGYIIYRNMVIFEALPAKIIRSRIKWDIALVFGLMFFVGGILLTVAFHFGSPEPFALVFGAGVSFLSYMAGDRTIKAAIRYYFVQRSYIQNVVMVLSPGAPWLLAIFWLLPIISTSLPVVIPQQLQSVTLGFPIIGIFFFYPIMIVALLSSASRVTDPLIRKNMRWSALLIITIMAIMVGGFGVAVLLHNTGAPLLILLFSLFLIAMALSYKSSMSIVVTHKLGKEVS